MPTQTQKPVAGYAHCTNARCEGNEQQQVEAVATETVFSYNDNGGDWGFPERSTILVSFADQDDAICVSCGGPREVTDQKRPQLEQLSGYDQRYLVSAGAQRFSKDKQVEVQDGRVEELEGQVATLSGQVEALLTALKADDAESEAA